MAINSTFAFSQTNYEGEKPKAKILASNKTQRQEIINATGSTVKISKEAYIVIKKQEENLAKSDSLILYLEKKLAERKEEKNL